MAARLTAKTVAHPDLLPVKYGEKGKNVERPMAAR